MIKTYPKIIWMPVMWAVVVVLVCSWGLAGDTYYENRGFPWSSGSFAGEFLKSAVILATVYAVRLALLLRAYFTSNKRNIGLAIVRGGIIGAILPEAFLLFNGFSMWQANGTYCTGTENSPCGWGNLAVIMVIVVSSVLQIIGELVGLAVGFNKNRRAD